MSDLEEKESSPEQPSVPTQEANNVPFGEDGKPLSKKALKKLKKKEHWQKIKHEKRAIERQKKKIRKQRKREQGEDLGPNRKRLKKNSMKKSKCKVRVVVDSSFDSYMAEKELYSHVIQLQHSYSANRRADNPLQFHVTSLSGPSKTRLDQIGDYPSWDVNFHEKHYLDVFPKEEVVYLSSDSPNVLDTLDEKKVYIIGGLVDHNRHKGLCHEKAEEAGVYHARLPIEEYIQLQTRKVLACNHVFEILLRYTELHDWEKAFFRVIPKRKGATEKENNQKSDTDENNSALNLEDNTMDDIDSKENDNEVEEDNTQVNSEQNSEEESVNNDDENKQMDTDNKS